MKITKYIPPTERNIKPLLLDDSEESRKLLHWFNPPPVHLHCRKLQEFLIWHNPTNPIANFITKRKLAENYFKVAVPKFEQGHTAEILYNKYLNEVVVPYSWGNNHLIEPKYLTWPCETYGAKKPDLCYRSNKTGLITISEVKMYYNVINFSHGKHILSAIDQLLLTDILMRENNFPEEFNLELVIITHEGVLPNLQSVIKKMDAINASRHLGIKTRMLNIFIPWEEF